MDENKELDALLNLIDDPDQEVFEAVSNRIIAYGAPIIPNLENLWENTIDDSVQEKIEILIHRLHFSNLLNDFKSWADSAHTALLPGALLVAKFLYPDLPTAKLIHDIERLKRNIWMELNNYLTPLEQVNVVNNILYNYFGLRGDYNNYEKPNEFLISHIIESKKGNQTGIGVLYLLLGELLDIPIRLIAVPNHFILAYFKSQVEKEQEKLHLNIEFFIDPVTGQPFTHNDLSNYFTRIELSPAPSYFKPRNNKQVIQKQLSDLGQCFKTGSKHYMNTEIQVLTQLFD